MGQENPVNLWDFIDALLLAHNVPKVKKNISAKRAYWSGALCETLFKTLGIYQHLPPMTRFLALQFSKSHFFSHKRALDNFGYYPQISIEEGLSLFKKQPLEFVC